MYNISKKVLPKRLQRSIKVYPIGNNKKMGWVNSYLNNLPKMSYTITNKTVIPTKKAIIDFVKYAGKKLNIVMGPHNSALITTDYATEIHIENLHEIELLLNVCKDRNRTIIPNPNTTGRICFKIPDNGRKSILQPLPECTTNQQEMPDNEADEQILDIRPEILDQEPELVSLEPDIIEFKFDMFGENPGMKVNSEIIEIFDDSDDEQKGIIEAPKADVSLAPQPASTSSGHKVFNFSQCPICFDITSPKDHIQNPINVCSRCSKLLHPKINKDIFIKNTIVFPCINAIFGCSSFYNELNKDKHLKTCIHKQRNCFVSNCNWVGNPNAFCAHILVSINPGMLIFWRQDPSHFPPFYMSRGVNISLVIFQNNHSKNIRFGHIHDIDVNLVQNPDNIYIVIAFETKEVFIIGTIFDCFHLNVFTVYTGNSSKAANFLYAIQIKDANRIVRNCYKYSQPIENIELENIRELGMRLKFNEILAYTKNDTFKLRIILQENSA